MATRFYLPSSGPAAVTPPALPSGWVAGTVPAYSAPAPTTKSDTAFGDFTVPENVAANLNIPVAILVSAPLAAQSIAGDVTAVIRAQEGASASDDSIQVGVYLIAGDGSAVKQTLYAGHAATLNATVGALGQEIASASSQTRIIPAQTMSTQSADAGDRLMLLVGYRTHEASLTVRDSTLRLGDPAAVADQVLTAGLTSDLDPWVELSITLGFAGGPVPIVVPVGQAVEVNTAGFITPRRVVALGRAVETDTAGTVSPRRLVSVGRAIETDTAGAITALHRVQVGQAVEIDTAQPIEVVGGIDPAAAGPYITTSSPVGWITTTSPRGWL